MTEKQRKYALVAGAGLLALFLLYRYYSARQGNASSTDATGASAAPDTAASDFATLAGQEQGDVAALQSQEQSDFGGLNTAVNTLTGQESVDFTGVTTQLGGLTDQLSNLAGLQAGVQSQIAGLATGAQPVSQAKIATHKGGPFYNYYVKVTGHAPPASVATSNFIYEAWKSGVKAAALAPPAKPHAGAKNTHVAHPNPQHHAKAGTAHPNQTATRSAPPPRAAHQPPPRPKPKPAPKPKPKTKPKASAPRK